MESEPKSFSRCYRQIGIVVIFLIFVCLHEVRASGFALGVRSMCVLFVYAQCALPVFPWVSVVCVYFVYLCMCVRVFSLSVCYMCVLCVSMYVLAYATCTPPVFHWVPVMCVRFVCLCMCLYM